MIGSLKQRLITLESDLKKIDQEEIHALAKAKRSLIHIKECCKELSLMSLKNEFKDKKEEIEFFKELKLSFYSKLYYFTDIINLESQRPNGSDKVKRKFLKEHLYKISEHFNLHRALYQYYRMELTDWDDKYFTQIKKFENKYDAQGNIIQCEDDYSSTHDLLFAKIIANDKFETYLRRELINLSNNKNTDIASVPDIEAISTVHKKLTWTASKSALTELIYAVHCSGSVNNGKADIKDIAEFVEAMFNVDLGDFYRTYVELRMRNHQTKYLDSLKDALLLKMDEDDEKENRDPLAKK